MYVVVEWLTQDALPLVAENELVEHASQRAAVLAVPREKPSPGGHAVTCVLQAVASFEVENVPDKHGEQVESSAVTEPGMKP